MSTSLTTTVIGPEALVAALAAQGVDVHHYAPPTTIPERLLGELVVAYADDAVSSANAAVAQHLLTTRPVLTGTAPAGLVVDPGTPRWVLLGGEPHAWDVQPEAVRHAAAATCVLEGWADDVAEGVQRITDGDVMVADAAPLQAAAPGTMAIGPSTPCWLVRDDATGREVVAPILHGGDSALWKGTTDRDAMRAERILAETLAPALNVALRFTGPVDILTMAEQAWAMGDDGAVRGRALSLLTLSRLLGALSARAPEAVTAAAELIPGDGFGLSMLCGAARATLAGLGHHGPSTIITGFSATEGSVSIQIAGLPGRWFRAQAHQSLDERGRPLAVPGDLGLLMLFGLGTTGDRLRAVTVAESRRFEDPAGPRPLGIDIRATLEADVAPGLVLPGVSADGGGAIAIHERPLPTDVQAAALAGLLESLETPGSVEEPASPE
ncbi:MAG: DUF1116 domain-containing protein [Thermoleophilia bacterium]